MALPRSGSRKYSLRLIPVLLSETRLSGCSYAAALPKSSRLCSDAVKLRPKLARQSLAGVSTCQRKVRAPQSRVLGNAQAPQGDEQGHRDEPVQSGVKRLVSVALFVALRRLGVTQHPALWSPDFPLAS